MSRWLVVRRCPHRTGIDTSAARALRSYRWSETKVDGLLDQVTVGGGDDTGPSLAERLMSTPNQYIAGGNEGLAQFKKGFLKFKTEVILTHPDHFRTLAASQSPKVMVIACCDSRVDPTLLMGAGPGDIFTVR